MHAYAHARHTHLSALGTCKPRLHKTRRAAREEGGGGGGGGRGGSGRGGGGGGGGDGGGGGVTVVREIEDAVQHAVARSQLPLALHLV